MYHRSETPSGSRAPSRYHGENESESENESIYDEGDDACLPFSGQSYTETEEFSEHALYESAFSSGHTHSQKLPYTTKVPPKYDGTTSFFTYEEHVRDWVSMTTQPEAKHGPLLKVV